MKLSLPELVLLGSLLVTAMAVAAALVLRGERRAKRIAGRLARVATLHARPGATSADRRPEAGVGLFARLSRRLGGAFGYDPARASRTDRPPAAVVGGAGAVAAATAVALAQAVGPMGLLAAPPLWMLASRFAFAVIARRRADRLYAQFPDALAMIVRSVRVGIPVSEALRAVAREAPVPTAEEFAHLSDQIAVGVAIEDALRELAARSGLPEYRFFATALSLQAQTGGGLSETLEGLADVIRKRVAMRARGHALASEARTSTYILAGLPVVTGGGLAIVNPSYIGLLLTEPMGNAVLAGAVGLLATGIGVMRVIIHKSLK